MPFTLGQRFISELLATMVVLAIGDGVIANEVLARTKGHALGLGHVSVGFGMAFFIAIVMFGGISASCNPAMVLAKAFVGYLSWRDALVLMVAEFIGAFIGAVVVYLTYLPHFSLVPTAPQKPAWSDPVVLPPEKGGTRAAFISYDGSDMAGVNRRTRAQLRRRRAKSYGGSAEIIEIADESEAKQDEDKPSFRLSTVEQASSAAEGVGPAFGGESKNAPPQIPEAMRKPTVMSQIRSALEVHLHPSGIKNNDSLMASVKMTGADAETRRAHLAALLADQNAKLSVFCTRPAIYIPGLNFLCEVIGTFFLIWTVLMMELRVELLPPQAKQSGYLITQAFLIGFMVVGLIMGLAGPTGYAANPARDNGPRFAHFILPIPNKGPSEWYYSWVPFFGPYVGAFLAAVVFFLCRQIYTYPPDYTGPDPASFGGFWYCPDDGCWATPQ